MNFRPAVTSEEEHEQCDPEDAPTHAEQKQDRQTNSADADRIDHTVARVYESKVELADRLPRNIRAASADIPRPAIFRGNR